MKILIDTHCWLWWLVSPDQLNTDTKQRGAAGRLYPWGSTLTPARRATALREGAGTPAGSISRTPSVNGKYTGGVGLRSANPTYG